MGKIPENYLPPKELWPERIYTLPEYRQYPDRLNSTEELVDRNVQNGNANRVAIFFEDKKITYRELYHLVNRLGNGLRGLGIEEGDRVIIRSPNIPQAVVANFAIIKIGAVSVPTSPLFARTEIAHVANNAEAKAVIVFAGLLEELERARDQFQTVKHIIVIGGKPDEVKARGYHVYDELVAGGGKELEPVRRGRYEVSVLH